MNPRFQQSEKVWYPMRYWWRMLVAPSIQEITFCPLPTLKAKFWNKIFPSLLMDFHGPLPLLPCVTCNVHPSSLEPYFQPIIDFYRLDSHMDIDWQTCQSSFKAMSPTLQCLQRMVRSSMREGGWIVFMLTAVVFDNFMYVLGEAWVILPL